MNDYRLTAVSGKTGVEMDEAFLTQITDTQLYGLMVQALDLLCLSQEEADRRGWKGYSIQKQVRAKVAEHDR